MLRKIMFAIPPGGFNSIVNPINVERIPKMINKILGRLSSIIFNVFLNFVFT